MQILAIFEWIFFHFSRLRRGGRRRFDLLQQLSVAKGDAFLIRAWEDAAAHRHAPPAPLVAARCPMRE